MGVAKTINDWGVSTFIIIPLFSKSVCTNFTKIEPSFCAHYTISKMIITGTIPQTLLG